MNTLDDKLRMLPDRPGVYLFRDVRGQILYVGKAKRLHLRVRSYFRVRGDADERLERLAGRIRDVDTIVTGSETEALILEANLIKQHRPSFNIELKDDKSFPCLKVTLNHRFPGLYLTRRLVPDGSRYFGPYTHVKDLRSTLKTLRRVFPLRNCTDRRVAQDTRECLEYFIDRCPAPCTKRIGEEDYAKIVRRLVRFLEGDVAQVIEDIRAQMQALARDLRFEESARLRDNIETLERLVLQQRMTPAVPADTDVVAIVARGDRASCVALHVRDGKVLGKGQRMVLRAGGSSAPEILRAYLAGAYLDAPQVPPEIVTAVAPREQSLVESSLAERAGHPVRIRGVRSGPLARLLDVARENAHLHLEEEELKERSRRDRVDSGVYNLQELLDLAQTPYRIEGYDISNLQSSHPVASKVVFQDGNPLKSAYRRFRIKQVQGPDDVAMIGEVLRRRLQRLKQGSDPPPDLILIDGGRGQVGRAVEVLREEGFAGVRLLGLAKREELVVLPDRSDPIRLPRNSDGLRLLQRVRDEAHRFAISYHRTLRSKGQVASKLDPLPGIGPRRRMLLLRHFGSVEAMRKADPAALTRVPGIGPRTARRIAEALARGAVPTSGAGGERG